jgi:hypothetical protein
MYVRTPRLIAYETCTDHATQAQDCYRKDPATPCRRSHAQARAAQGQAIVPSTTQCKTALYYIVLLLLNGRQSSCIDSPYTCDNVVVRIDCIEQRQVSFFMFIYFHTTSYEQASSYPVNPCIMQGPNCATLHQSQDNLMFREADFARTAPHVSS